MRIVEDQTVILGPPGCGKTTSILNKIEVDLKRVPPEHIALVSFTKKAVGEAVHRVSSRFGFDKQRLPLFQTIHALCYRQLGCQKSDLMTRQNYAELGEILGYPLEASINMEDGALVIPDQDKGSKLLFVDNMARIMRRPLKDVWREADINVMWPELERFSNAYRKYKEQTGKMDFTDILDRYIENGKPVEAEIAYIDEAQDLSRIQWEVLQKCFCEAKRVIIAGDDDQSIFKWSGADLGTFLSLEGEKTVLAHSYRLPQAVYNKAEGIVKRVKQRFDKPFTPAEHTGKVNYVSSLDAVKINPEVKTLILVRNVYLLKDVYEYLKLRGHNFTGRGDYKSVDPDHVRAISTWESIRRGEAVPLDNVRNMYEYLRLGVVLARGGKAALAAVDDKETEYFTWETLRDHFGLLDKPIWHKALLGIPLEKREYYISMLRRKHRLSAAPNIHVNTIHGVKGGEADHVIVLSDMSKRTYEEMMKDPCSEHRVAYVAVTRSKQDLTIVMAQGRYSYGY